MLTVSENIMRAWPEMKQKQGKNCGILIVHFCFSGRHVLLLGAADSADGGAGRNATRLYSGRRHLRHARHAVAQQSVYTGIAVLSTRRIYI